MSSLSAKIPEIKSSKNPDEVQWETSVVWSDYAAGGERIYEWLEDKHIRYVSWTNGIVSVIPSPDSFLSEQTQCLLLSGGFVWVGKKVKVG